ncbi:hypothetical protein [Streptomyces griseorubiginosus]|uniref:hypothetical protein n=1 Tax=Streptomyces griseorubiginosus TaxID=67304 RepID=UPI00114079E8|nr:hypothetical protein [Streptomyces griseorubiginosus]
MTESRVSAGEGAGALSGTGVGGLFKEDHSAVVKVAFGVAAWGVEEGSLSFGKIAVQQAHGHAHGFHSVAPVALEELLQIILLGALSRHIVRGLAMLEAHRGARRSGIDRCKNASGKTRDRTVRGDERDAL